MSIPIIMAIFFAFMGVVFLFANRFGSDNERWFDKSKFSVETLITVAFVSAFWCFIFS
jgi:Na+/proline symporter